MKRVAVSGTIDGVNTAFTLAEASVTGGVTFVVRNGQILKSVAAAPTGMQVRISGTALTMGVAPIVGETLWAFISTTLTTGLSLVALGGVQDGANVTFTLPSALAANSHVLLCRNGQVLNEVAAPPSGSTFSISGTTLTMGIAPSTTDVLSAYVQESASVFFHELPLSGAIDGANTRFTASFAFASGYEPLLLVLLSGIVVDEVDDNPGAIQFAMTFQNRTITLIMGAAPSSTASLSVYLIGLTTAAGISSLLNLRSLERRLIVLMNSMIDAGEARMCLDEQWRKLTTEEVLSFMKTDIVVSTLPTKSTGTLSLIQGSNLIVGTGTTPASTDVGGFFLLNNQPYEILSVDTSARIYEVAAPYVGATNTAASYTLYHNRYQLDPDVAYIITMAGAHWHMEERTKYYLDWTDPGRTVFGEPYYYAYLGPTAGGIERIEVWPIPNARYNFHYTGMRRSALESATETIMDISDVLLKFAAALACRIVANKMAARMEWSGAGFWNSQAQEWELTAQQGLTKWLKQDRKRFWRNRRTSTRISHLSGRTDIDFGY